MGYRIDYQPYGHSKYTKKRRISVLAVIVAMVMILTILANVYAGSSRALLLEMIFPGDAALTIASFDTMVEEMKAGTSFADAIQSFCRQVVSG